MVGETFNNSPIDRGIGWLFLVSGVVAFVMVVILGMANVEEHAESASNGPKPSSAPEEGPIAELVNSSAE